MKRTVVLNVVGLTRNLIGPHTPHIQKFAAQNSVSSFPPAFPAVTCTAQSTYLTGTEPPAHGSVANGWYDRESAEVRFWKQSNPIVKGPKIWDTLRKQNESFTCANMFWWYNMYSTADYSTTPRPLYRADGKKVFDIHTHPMHLREDMKADLGDFPFPSFWGPKAGIASSRWIAQSAKWIEKKHEPTLNFVYLPHLDYCLQKLGPNDKSVKKELKAIDKIVGDLIDHFRRKKVQVCILSEYGITAVTRPIHLNRIFRQSGWIRVKDELGGETLDCGTSPVFAVADHQVAHIYISDPGLKPDVQRLLESITGVESVEDTADWPDGPGKDRAGDLIVTADADSWFTYYYWEEDEKAPDFARTIDIHRKPGYDPAELFIDPSIRVPFLKIVFFLLKKTLGFRTVLDVIPLDAHLVKGSHGRKTTEKGDQPVFIGPTKIQAATEVHGALLKIVNPS